MLTSFQIHQHKIRFKLRNVCHLGDTQVHPGTLEDYGNRKQENHSVQVYEVIDRSGHILNLNASKP